MIRSSWLLVSTIIVAGNMAVAFPWAAGINTCPPVFSDEFDGARLDTTRWQPTYRSGDAEQQSYVPDVLQVSGGRLRLTAQPQSGQDRPYASGIITTQGTFSQQYGYFEMRARVPHGQGLWPAFWLLHTGRLPWTEIDVLEILGNDTTKLYMSNHWRDGANQHQSLTQPSTGPDFSAGFHFLRSTGLLVVSPGMSTASPRPKRATTCRPSRCSSWLI